MTSLVMSLSRFPIFLTVCYISLLSWSCFLWSHVECNLLLWHSNWMDIKYYFVWCTHYVVRTSFVTSQNRFLNICHDFRKIFCLLTSFVSAWCIWLPVTSYQMNWHSISFRLMHQSCGYDVACGVRKPFSKYMTRFS